MRCTDLLIFAAMPAVSGSLAAAGSGVPTAAAALSDNSAAMKVARALIEGKSKVTVAGKSSAKAVPSAVWSSTAPAHRSCDHLDPLE